VHLGCFCRRARGHAVLRVVKVLVVIAAVGAAVVVAAPALVWTPSGAVAEKILDQLAELQSQVDYRISLDEKGRPPMTVLPAWFPNGVIPSHPENSLLIPTVQSYSIDPRPHPVRKVLRPGVAGAYWYNALTGTVRARVKDQGSAAATLALYNRVNDSREKVLGNYGGAGM